MNKNSDKNDKHISKYFLISSKIFTTIDRRNTLSKFKKGKILA